MLKALLAQNKINIDTKILERGIVMPRDMESNAFGYPRVIDFLSVNPFRVKKENKKKRKKRDEADAGNKLMRSHVKPVDGVDMGSPPFLTEKGEYRVYEFGNLPLLSDGKPKAGVFRMMLPSEADWTGFPLEKEEVENKKQKIGRPIQRN